MTTKQSLYRVRVNYKEADKVYTLNTTVNVVTRDLKEAISAVEEHIPGCRILSVSHVCPIDIIDPE